MTQVIPYKAVQKYLWRGLFLFSSSLYESLRYSDTKASVRLAQITSPWQ